MNDAILLYVASTYHDDLGRIVVEAIHLLHAYNDQTLEARLLDILMSDEETTSEAVQDGFLEVLHQHLDRVLEAHSLRLNPEEATLNDKVATLDVFYRIQDLDDYSNILPILESTLDPYEKLAEIMMQMTQHIRQTDVYRLMLDFRPEVLDCVRTMIYAKKQYTMEDLPAYTAEQKTIIENIRLFKRFCETKALPKIPIGIQMVESFVIVGQPFKAYLPYLTNAFTEQQLEFTALNILSVLLISSDGGYQPLMTYRDYSHQLLDTVNFITRVDVYISQFTGLFDRFKQDQKVSP